ncbi:TIGR04086 family membrane protein [Corynebacterium cystitidis]|uniref:TIGR04086 family membrane protein n=1 Tax=Corynebacterium cystitidis TaxID=35757 RepID=UPI00211DDFCB|nr:TIGR04086 family membrane protein [Corynebacterium cystitidis]
MSTPQNEDRNLDRNATTHGEPAAKTTPTYKPQRGGTQAYNVETETHPDDHSAQEAFIGTSDYNVSNGNVSWGAIFAGVVTFLAIMILLGVGAGAMGLQDSSGAAIGIFTLIGLVIAFLAAGYVAGALGVRGGLFHGFATWATSVIAVIILAGWLGTSLIGTAGNIVGTVAQTGAQAAEVTSEDAQSASDAIDPEEANEAANKAQDAASQAANQAQETLNEVAPQAAEGTWWTFAGLLIGALLSSLAGVAGARSVINKERRTVVRAQN